MCLVFSYEKLQTHFNFEPPKLNHHPQAPAHSILHLQEIASVAGKQRLEACFFLGWQQAIPKGNVCQPH